MDRQSGYQEVDEEETQVPMTMAQLACFLGQSPGPTTAEEIETWVDRRIMLERAMKGLSARDARVLSLRLANMVYEDVALLMKMTRERVRFIEARALDKVRKAVAQMQAADRHPLPVDLLSDSVLPDGQQERIWSCRKEPRPGA